MDYREELMNFAQKLKMRSSRRIDEVIIFGSAAREELDEESDVDVLVVVNRKDRKLVREIELFCVETMKKINRVVSPLILDRSTYDEMVKERYPFIINVKREGVVYA